MERIRVVVKQDWVEQGKMLVLDAKAITFRYKQFDDGEPEKIIVCHSDFEALKIKVAIEDAPNAELVE